MASDAPAQRGFVRILRPRLLVTVALLFGTFLLGKYLGRVSSARGPSANVRGLVAACTRSSASHQVFVLDIHFTFKSEKDRDKFIQLWRPLAKHVLLHEPGTLSYELSVGDSDPLRVLVFERYRTKDDYHLHKASKPFEEFHNALRESKIEWTVKEGQSYYETGVGFMYVRTERVYIHPLQPPLPPAHNTMSQPCSYRGPALDVKTSQKRQGEPRKQAAGVNRPAPPVPP